MSKRDERQLDAYLGGDLSSHEQRTLAQQALDDPELFEQLATAAAINSTAANEPIGPRSHKIRGVWLLTGAAAAAAVIVAIVSIERAPSPGVTTPPPDAPPVAATEPSTPPVPAVLQPILLTARLDILAGQASPEFRSAAEASREPKSSGVVVGVENGDVTIDLGALDGITKGTQLEVLRGTGESRLTARLTIATVFRERSRGRVSSPDSVQAGDRVDVPADLQLNALLEHAVARVAAGDSAAARTLANRGVKISSSATQASSADAMNDLAAVLIRERDYPGAEVLLRRALVSASGPTKMHVTNNLAALAALTGDFTRAESTYRSALQMAGTSPAYESARRSIEKNLQDLGAVR